MPVKNGVFTPQERAFVKAYAATGDRRMAGEAAGYAHPTVAAANALARPAVAAEVARLQLERIQNELLPLAVDVHRDLLMRKDVPAGARIQAVKLAYDRAFGDQDKLNGKEPHEMTADELAREIERLKRQEARANAADVVVENDQAAGVFD